MSSKLLLTTFAVVAATITAPSAFADRHYVPGMGTYGVSTEQTRCSTCGSVYTRGEGHMCERPDRQSSRQSSSGSYADDRAAQGRISSDPDLLINQTSYTPVDYSNYSSSPSESYSSSESYSYDDDNSYDYDSDDSPSDIVRSHREGRHRRSRESHTFRNVIITMLVAGGAYYLYRRFKRKGKK